MSIFQDRQFKGERASSLFAVLAGDDEKFLFMTDDNSLCFGFLCTPLEGSDRKASDRINVLLNGDWPEDTLMQFCLFGSQDIHKVMNEAMNLRKGKGTQLTAHNSKRRSAFFLDGTKTPIEKNSGVKARNFSLVVSVKIPINDSFPTDKEMARVADLRTSFAQSLRTVGLRPMVIDRHRYVHLFNTILNWGDAASWRAGRQILADDDKPLREQILDFDHSVSVDRKGLWLGEPNEEGSVRVSNLSIKRYPRVFEFGSAAAYLGDLLMGSRGIRDNCMISATIHYPAFHKTKSRLEQKRQWAVNQAYGPMLKFVPMLAAKKHGFDVLFQALDDGDRIVRLHFGMTLFTNSDEEATIAISNARSYWGELGMSIMEDKFFNLPLFLNRLPFGADREAMGDTFRYKTMATRHAIPLLPVFSDWRGSASPVMNFISRNGQVMSMDLFDSPTNYNCTIAAQSGSGKSFLANEMISSYLSIGGKVWVIDVGRSYKDLCEIYNGDFVEFDRQSKICLNPFPLVQEFSEEEDMLVGLICAMAAPTQKLSDFQTAELKKCLGPLWAEKGKATTIDDLAERLSRSSDQRVLDIAAQLYPFTSKGEYGRFFAGENNVTFQADFSVLELEELKGRKHLQQVVLLQLIYQIQQDMYLGDRNRPKIVIIDEAWSLLTEGDVASFIEHGFRRFRKYNGAAIVITQSVTDLYGTPTGRAIAENSAHMFLLGQKDDAISTLQKEDRLPLSQGGYTLLKSVHTEPGVYSEIFFLTEYGAGIGRLIVDRYHQILYSTHPNDVQAIADYRKQGLSANKAIEQIMRDRGLA